jgi:ribosomal protein L7/L12
MDFDKYVNSLNELDNQENKTELESFYTLHSAVLQFFKAIEKTLQDLMTRSSVSPIVVKQLETVMPTLTKLKREITMLDINTFHISYKSKANKMIDYIKNDMTISEVDDIFNDFWALLKENENAFVVEQEEKKRKEKEEFNVILISAGRAKLAIVKLIKELTGVGMKDAKDIVDAAPSKIKEGISKGEADFIKSKLEQQGATVELKAVPFVVNL